MISILMPVYNTEKKMLEASIESCLQQTFQEFEFIIINNGSTLQETNETLKKFVNNKKIKIFNCEQKNNVRNLSVALNYGITKCSNSFIARMDSDDVMLPNRLEKQLNYMINNTKVGICGTQIVISDTKEVSKLPKIIEKNIVYSIYRDWFVSHPTVMIRKEVFNQIGTYAETPKHYAEDLELWYRALSKNVIIHNLEEPLLIYTNNLNSISHIDGKQEEYVFYKEKIKKDFIKTIKEK